jgi:hypothetical protein
VVKYQLVEIVAREDLAPPISAELGRVMQLIDEAVMLSTNVDHGARIMV